VVEEVLEGDMFDAEASVKCLITERLVSRC